jgi:predicted alpha/beta-fold hydrolase
VPPGVVSIDWLRPANLRSNTPIVIIVPGLTGDSSTGYVRRVVGTLSLSDPLSMRPSLCALRCAPFSVRLSVLSSSISLVLAGLTSSLHPQAAAVVKRGYIAACFNPRGRGGNPLKTPLFYSVRVCACLAWSVIIH